MQEGAVVAMVTSIGWLCICGVWCERLRVTRLGLSYLFGNNFENSRWAKESRIMGKNGTMGRRIGKVVRVV